MKTSFALLAPHHRSFASYVGAWCFLAATTCLFNYQGPAFAGTATIVGSGNWSNPATWSSTPAGFSPNNGNNGENWSATLATYNVTVDVPVAIEGLAMSGGTLLGGGAVTVNSASTWSGGTITGVFGITSDTITFALGSSLVISGGGTKLLSERTLFNNGSVSHTGGTLAINSNGIFNNTLNGTFNASPGATSTVLSGAGVFTNAGIFNKNDSGNTVLSSAMALNNTGTVNVNGGQLRLQGGGTSTGIFDIDPGTTLRISAANYSMNAGTTFSGTGTLEILSNTTTFNGAGGASTANVSVTGGTASFAAGSSFTTTGAYTQSSGFTVLAGGALVETSAFNLNGGALQGSGTITGPMVTSGSTTITPGASAGTITVNGSALLGGGNTLLMEIGGMTQGTLYDYLDVNGGLTLGGLLDVDFINSFQNSVLAGDMFTIATANSAILGAFSNVASGGEISTNAIPSFLVWYGAGSPFGASNLVLTATPEPSRSLLLVLGFGILIVRRRRA